MRVLGTNPVKHELPSKPIITCSNPPTTKCPECSVHYCHEHVYNHFHELTDEEIERRNREAENLK